MSEGELNSIMVFLGVVVNAIMVVFVAMINTKAKDAAIAVEEVKVKAAEAAEIVKEVKTNLESSNTQVSEKLNGIHKLVNSNLGLQLRLNADNSRWRADMSKKPEDIKAADEAEKLLAEHEENQKRADNE